MHETGHAKLISSFISTQDGKFRHSTVTAESTVLEIVDHLAMELATILVEQATHLALLVLFLSIDDITCL